MDLATLASTTPQPGHKECQCCWWLDQNPDLAPTLISAMRNPNVRFSQIADADELDGAIPAHALRRHARGECLARTRLR